jgi:hypothetical protein
MTFTSAADYPGQPSTTCAVTTDAESLNEILGSFEQFLKGAGFVFDGTVEITNEDNKEYVSNLEDSLMGATDLLKRFRQHYTDLRRGLDSGDHSLVSDIERFLERGGAK